MGTQRAQGADPGQRPGDEALLSDLTAALAGHRAPRVGVLRMARPSPLTAALRALGDHVGVSAFDATRLSGRLHAELAAVAPFDVLVDDTRHGPGRDLRFRFAFLHVAPGGSYVVAARRAGTAQARARGTEPVSELLDRLQRLGPAGPGASAADLRVRDEHSLAGRMGTVTTRGRHLWVRRNHEPVWAKLAEDEANVVLQRRGAVTGSFEQRHPSQTFVSRGLLHESESERSGNTAESFSVPAMFVRTYHGAVCSPGQLVTSDNLLLPDSYRHPVQRRLHNRYLSDLAPRFAAPEQLPGTPQRLPGCLFYLDSEFRGHFGHALTEQVSRLWAWPEARERHPGIKALVAASARRPDLAGFELELLAAAQITADDIVLLREPAQVEQLVAATPMFSNPGYVHPEITSTWRRIGDALVGSVEQRARPGRIFCTRPVDEVPGSFGPDRRRCRNTAEVERLFVAHGFTVVRPEQHSMAEQAALFRQAEVVAGFAGSGMFNLLFADSATTVVLVSSEAYRGKNEHLICAALGHRLHVAWCRPDRPEVNSSYAFDVAREGRFVERVLAGVR